MTGTINLTKEAALVDGKVAYTGTGTVLGFANTAVSIYWIGAPDNVWVLAYDGQPYFFSSCNNNVPPATSTCSWTEVTPGTCTGTSALVITGTGTILPVRFISFTAQKVGTTVQLTWKTAFESNNKGFEVQRSTDGIRWTSLGFVAAGGIPTAEQTYQFEDPAPRNGKNYYRLLQSDIDNHTTYSTIAVVEVAHSGYYTLRQSGNGSYLLNLDTEQPVKVTVLDPGGRTLFTRMAAPGLQHIDISAYAKGIYFLQLNNNSLRTTEKLIKR